MSKVVCWWSGGITSAVACKKAIDIYGVDNCRVIFIDTHNEHEDTYRFLNDCELWYGIKIETITEIGDLYKSIQDVWKKHLSLNVASGAICSSKLKRVCREKWQKENDYTHQVFGFEFESKEFKRALSLNLNHPKTKAIFPLLMLGLNKQDCISIVQEAGLTIPEMYVLGFTNNNCFKTGCIQGGIGYWKKMQKDFPDKFKKMAEMEHELTEMAGEPVTILKDQSNSAKLFAQDDKKSQLVFLVRNAKYSNKSIDDMTGREVEPLVDCNGFCGVNDLVRG